MATRDAAQARVIDAMNEYRASVGKILDGARDYAEVAVVGIDQVGEIMVASTTGDAQTRELFEKASLAYRPIKHASAH